MKQHEAIVWATLFGALCDEVKAVTAKDFMPLLMTVGKIAGGGALLVRACGRRGCYNIAQNNKWQQLALSAHVHGCCRATISVEIQRSAQI